MKMICEEDVRGLFLPPHPLYLEVCGSSMEAGDLCHSSSQPDWSLFLEPLSKILCPALTLRSSALAGASSVKLNLVIDSPGPPWLRTFAEHCVQQGWALVKKQQTWTVCALFLCLLQVCQTQFWAEVAERILWEMQEPFRCCSAWGGAAWPLQPSHLSWDPPSLPAAQVFLH